MKLLYLHEEGKKRYRVWRSDWVGDQFEIINQKDWSAFKHEVDMYNEHVSLGMLNKFNLTPIELDELIED